MLRYSLRMIIGNKNSLEKNKKEEDILLLWRLQEMAFAVFCFESAGTHLLGKVDQEEAGAASESEKSHILAEFEFSDPMGSQNLDRKAESGSFICIQN